MQEDDKTRGAVPKELKIKNRRSVLTAFLSGDTLSAIDVANMTGISRQTVQKSIEHFIQIGMLLPLGKGASGSFGGKRPEMYMLNPERYFLAIQNRTLGYNMVLTNMLGRVLKRVHVSQAHCTSQEDIYRSIREAAQMLLSSAEFERLLGVCYSLGGVVDRKTEKVRFNIVYFFKLAVDELDYKQLLGQFPTVRYAIVENDARVAAYAVLADYAEKIANTQAITVFTGVGIAGGFFHEGKMLFGGHSLVGEIGHIVVDPSDTEVCKCGNRGCLERQVSIERIRSRLIASPDRYEKSRLAGAPVEQVEYEDVFAAAAAGDELCGEISRELGQWYAAALRTIFVTFDPEIIIFQGHIAYADENFKQALLEGIRSFKYYPPQSDLEIIYDRRTWDEVETAGSVAALLNQIMEDEELFA